MYVGPWQEYKLMRVIEDLRGELNKQQELLQQQQPTVRTTALPPVTSATTVYDQSPAASTAPQMVTRKEKERQEAQQRARPPYRVYDTPLPADATAKGRCVTCNHSETDGASNTNYNNSYGDYVIRDIKAPTYGRNEEQLLMQMGLPPISSAAITADGTNGAPRALQQHPYVKDLSRRVPLDTEAVSARAGQRFYKRAMAEPGKGTTRTPLGNSHQQQQQPPPSYKGGNATSGEGADTVDDKRRKKLVERRLRLQALYRAGGNEADLLEDEETDEEDEASPPKQQQPGGEEEADMTRRFSDPTAMHTGGHIYASPIPLPSPLPVTNVAASLEDIFKKTKPPTPKKIEEDDVGGLLDWANQLNDDWMK